MRLPPGLKTPSATIALGAAVLLLVAVGGWTLLLGPATGALGTARVELSDAQDSTDMLQTRLRRLEAQRDSLGVVEKEATRLAELFPTTADQPGFFALMAAATARAGIPPRQVTTLSPAAPAPWDPAAGAPAKAGEPSATPSTPATPGSSSVDLAVQQVEVSVEASYEQARQLLAGLERMDRSFLVQSVTVTAGEKPGSYLVSATGSTFVAPPLTSPSGKPVAPADSTAGSGTDGGTGTGAAASSGSVADSAADSAAGSAATGEEAAR